MDCKTVIIRKRDSKEQFFLDINNFIGKSNVKAVAINITKSGAWYRATITYLDLSSCKYRRKQG